MEKLKCFKVPHISKQVLVVVAVVIDKTHSGYGRTWLNHALAEE
ncbi:hypothetical protein [Chroococcidiopsis sp. SAG 2025]|nr:hypothetical protein [Chroococcidiopsis sp. SAG 2025]